jgi:3-methyladenine DNA glycosylase AlkC
MAKKFKDYYDTDCARLIAGKIALAWPAFKKEEFVQILTQSLVDKEFYDRQDAFVDAFELFMPPDYNQTIHLFHQILGQELQTTEGMFTYGWWLWPVGRYVERHGTRDFDVSMNFIYELTKRFTGEFAIRPLIAQHPEKALQVILKWSLDENVHVRRLSSEGIRTRLPWAKKSLVAVSHFEIYKAILSNLKNDPEKFVQKSVGNNLNDLMKDFPEKAKETITEWENEHPGRETAWIIRHGLRSERKKQKHKL